jgi:hypothetical protein
LVTAAFETDLRKNSPAFGDSPKVGLDSDSRLIGEPV